MPGRNGGGNAHVRSSAKVGRIRDQGVWGAGRCATPAALSRTSTGRAEGESARSIGRKTARSRTTLSRTGATTTDGPSTVLSPRRLMTLPAECRWRTPASRSVDGARSMISASDDGRRRTYAGMSMTASSALYAQRPWKRPFITLALGAAGATWATVNQHDVISAVLALGRGLAGAAGTMPASPTSGSAYSYLFEVQRTFATR